MSLLLLPIITIIVFHRVKNVIKTAGFARGGCNQVRIFPELQTRAKKRIAFLNFALYVRYIFVLSSVLGIPNPITSTPIFYALYLYMHL